MNPQEKAKLNEAVNYLSAALARLRIAQQGTSDSPAHRTYGMSYSGYLEEVRRYLTTVISMLDNLSKKS